MRTRFKIDANTVMFVYLEPSLGNVSGGCKFVHPSGGLTDSPNPIARSEGHFEVGEKREREGRGEEDLRKERNIRPEKTTPK